MPLSGFLCIDNIFSPDSFGEVLRKLNIFILSPIMRVMINKHTVPQHQESQKRY